MERIGEIRSRIYRFFQDSKECWGYFSDKAHSDEYVRYYTSMYLLQDSTEGLQAHMCKGFSEDPKLAYIEMWGVMQSVVIQQDSIKTLYGIILKSDLKISDDSKWKEIRTLRNQCAGHPGNHGQRYRSFFGRGNITYTNLRYERRERSAQDAEYVELDYKKLILKYVEEACSFLSDVEEAMRTRWPKQK